MSGRVIIIGDVHGMVDELNRLIVKLDLRRGDRLCWLGDYVDKGPESLEALHMVRMLVSQYPGSVAICGNHEESAMRLYAKAQKQGNWDGLRKALKEPWLKSMSQSDYDWMRTLPLVARPLPGVVMVHGGMFPAYFDKHLAIGADLIDANWHKGGGKRMDRMRRFLRVRHVYKPGVLSAKGKDIGGNMVSLGDEGSNTLPWGDWYDGREGFAFYGHAPQKSGEPVLHSHAMGLDTGAVFGAKLTAAVLRPGQDPRNAEIVDVQAGRAHADWLKDFEAE